ncbi:YncE family protein [Brevundimonas sp. SL161]|uniref:YncE family protein n=1 Tax=Brevundimonas sp. SL161 TaxID=2804613 RepID=UPI003CF1E772
MAQIAVSAHDGKQVLIDGVQTVPANPAPDGVMVLDLSGAFPRVIGMVALPTSVIGPPASVAVAPDESFALVTASRRIPAEAPTTIVADDQISVIDLTSSPPRVTATLHAGAGASGVSINPAGTLALVANRSEGTVSIFTIADGVLTDAGKVTIGPATTSPAHVIFFDQGRRALVSRDGDHRISLLTISGTEVTVEAQTLAPGLRPYQIDSTGPRTFAVSANIGGGGRDTDTLALIDLREVQPRVVDVVAAGLTPEGVKMSPDGRYVAATVNDGSNAPPTSPRWHRQGQIKVWRIEDSRLIPVAEALAGAWGQGLAWSSDGHTLLAQSAADNRIDVYHFDGWRLTRAGEIPTPAGPAGIRTAEP